MKTENTIKKEWQSPEIIDLDVKSTEGGAIPFDFELTINFNPLTHPAS